MCDSCWENHPDFYPLRERRLCLFGDPNSQLSRHGSCSKRSPACGFAENVKRCFKKHTLYLGRFRDLYKIGISGRSGKWIDLRLLEQGFNEGYIVNGFQSVIEARQWEDWFNDLGFPRRLSTEMKLNSLRTPIEEDITLSDTFDLRDWEQTFAQYKVTCKSFFPMYKGSPDLAMKNGVDGRITYVAGSNVITEDGWFTNLSKLKDREVLKLSHQGSDFEVEKTW